MLGIALFKVSDEAKLFGQQVGRNQAIEGPRSMPNDVGSGSLCINNSGSGSLTSNNSGSGSMSSSNNSGSGSSRVGSGSPDADPDSAPVKQEAKEEPVDEEDPVMVIGDEQGWKSMSCGPCQGMGQKASWLRIGYTQLSEQFQSEAGSAS